MRHATANPPPRTGARVDHDEAIGAMNPGPRAPAAVRPSRQGRPSPSSAVTATASRVRERAATGSEARARRQRDVAEAHARTVAAARELNEASAASEESYRLMRSRLDDFDRRLQAVAATLRDPGKPPARRPAQGPHC